MDYLWSVCAITTARAMIVYHVRYPDLAVAVYNDLVVWIVTIRSAFEDCLFGLPSDCARAAECSDSELEVSATIVLVSGLVIASVEHVRSVGVYAEIAVGDVDRDGVRSGPS